MEQQREADWLTVISIAAIATCMTFVLHETSHAITCAFVGQLQELGSHHAKCVPRTACAEKLVDASGSLASIAVGFAAWGVLRWGRVVAPAVQFFLWLLATMNLLSGAGYWAFSGTTNLGDWSVVIRGLQPHWLWRASMAIFGGCAVIFVAMTRRRRRSE